MTIRVLLASDETVIADGLRQLLGTERDMNVVGHAVNADDALRQCRTRRPQVVVMDRALPSMTGVEATRLVRARFPDVRVVFLSRYGDIATVMRALRSGAGAYVLKKAGSDELLKAIREVARGRTHVPADLAAGVITLLSDARPDPLERLSVRERQVLQMVAEGLTSSEIGARLSLSRKSVDTYRARMMSKLNIRNLAALVKFAIWQGVIQIER